MYLKFEEIFKELISSEKYLKNSFINTLNY